MVRKFWPRERSDRFALVFFLFAISWVFAFEAFLVLPTIYEPNDWMRMLHITNGLFICIQILMNFYYVIATNTTSGSYVLPTVQKPEWRFCSACEIYQPPRSFHCHFCNLCVLKRDHHCMFTGNCIGHANMRYYMWMIIYTWLGALYSNILNFDFVWGLSGKFGFLTLFSSGFPILSWAFGLIDHFSFVASFTNSLCLVGFIILTLLIGYHIGSIAAGQTVNERSHNVHDYDLGWKENFLEVFGNKWYLTWLMPYVHSQYKSDGIVFRKKGSRLTAPKDM